jgi:hypothetical protein
MHAPSTRAAAEPFPAVPRWRREEKDMTDPKKPGEQQEEQEREAEESRERLDEVPPPGTDPLHEGP